MTSCIALRPCGPHTVSDGTTEYPVVDGIPYLRSGRDELCASVLRALEEGRTEDAQIMLLRDRDDWASGPGPRDEDLRRLVREPGLSLREAMRLLAYGPVADYFAYRWSDPTYLSGLALLDLGMPDTPRAVVEVACGIGHFLRELGQRQIPAVGIDVVFSKLWLAKRYLAPHAELICADAAAGLPLADASVDVAFCHDAFYFFQEKEQIARELRRVSTGAVLVGHVHHRDAEALSPGAPLSVQQYASLFPDADLYDDAELSCAFLERRSPRPSPASALRRAEAVSLVANAASTNTYDFARPVGILRLNPLLADGARPQWPSARYEAEYGPLSGYLQRRPGDPVVAARWTPALDDLTRRRVLLALPERW